MDNWVLETNRWHCKNARHLTLEHSKWEEQKIKDGYKPVKIPHPEVINTYIIRYVK